VRTTSATAALGSSDRTALDTVVTDETSSPTGPRIRDGKRTTGRSCEVNVALARP
jgi:hypothetical protein